MTTLRVPEGATDQEKGKIKSNLDMVMAGRHFRRFLEFVKILERPQRLMKIKGGKRDMELWDHTIEIADAMTVEQKLVIIKARQIGASWVAAAYACWLFRFYPGSLVGMFSKDQPKAIRLMAKVNFIYKNMPKAWQLPLASDSKLEMELEFEEGVSSLVTAFSANADSGRGDDFSLVIMDEADFHEDLEEAYPTLAGSVGSTGGQMFLISTINKVKAESVFVSSVTGAPDNGWTMLFYDWRVRPGRDDAWYEREKNAIPKTSVLTPELFMSQEFPGSLEEALEPAGALAFFDLNVLEYMKQHVREPMIKVGATHYYTRHQVGHRYACGTDTAHGIGQDYSASYLIDLDAAAVVARVLSNHLDTTVFANDTLKMLEKYDNPLWAIETEGWGIDVVRAAERAGYYNLYGKRRSANQRRENGWTPTDMARRTAWFALKDEINSGRFILPDAEGLEQLKQCIVVGDHGRMEARKGANDDVPTAMALAVIMGEEVPQSAPSSNAAKFVPGSRV